MEEDKENDGPPPLLKSYKRDEDSSSDEPSVDDDNVYDGPPPLLRSFQRDDDSSSDESPVCEDDESNGPPPLLRRDDGSSSDESTVDTDDETSSTLLTNGVWGEVIPWTPSCHNATAAAAGLAKAKSAPLRWINTSQAPHPPASPNYEDDHAPDNLRVSGSILVIPKAIFVCFADNPSNSPTTVTALNPPVDACKAILSSPLHDRAPLTDLP